MADNCRELKVLLNNRQKLMEAFKSTDLNILCNELLSGQVLTKGTAKAFDSLDHDKVDLRLRVRYILQQICKRVREKAMVCDSLLVILWNSDVVSERVRNTGRDIRNQLDSLRGGTEADTSLVEEDLFVLMDILSECSSKWDDVGLSLGLPNSVIEGIGKDHDSVNSKLRVVLSKWLTGRYLPVTLTKLENALGSNLVQENFLAYNLKEKFRVSKDRYCVPPTKKQRLEPLFRIEYQSRDIEVTDGKSVLLEVQVTSSEPVVYRWMKDSKLLSESGMYSGTDSDILVIHRASQETRGNYTCNITNGVEYLSSEDIILSVAFCKDKRHLLNRYSKLVEVSRDSWSLPTTSKFINLALIKEGGQLRKADRYFTKGDIDSILLRKEKVSYEEVFGKYESGSLIIVEGRPGSGKTTLACKIARDWAIKGNVIRYAEQIFLLPLRAYKKTTFIMNLFDNILKRAEDNDGEGFCFIFDGLDEWQQNDENDVIQSLLEKEYLPNAMVIVMSRPAATVAYRHEATKRIEVLGFSKEQVYEYIEMYPFEQFHISKKEIVTKLKAYLNVHTNVLHMCYLPVHAAMICFLYSLNGDNMPQTETQIYEYFTRSIILRKVQQKNRCAQLKSLHELPTEFSEHFKMICCLAFNMVCTSKQTMSEADLPFDSQSPPFSLLTIDRMAQSCGLDGVITFLHLTHQEYLAAYHIASLDSQKQSEVIKRLGDKEEMQTTWKFYCGLFSLGKSTTTHFEQLMRAMKTSHLYKVQCAYESQEHVFCNKVVEILSGTFSFNSHVITPSDFTAVKYFLETTTLPLSSFSMQMCTSNELQSQSKELESIDISSIIYESTPKRTITKMIKMFPAIVDKYFKLSAKDREEFKLKAKKTYYGLLSINLSNFGIDADTISDLLGYFSSGKSSILTSEYAKPLVKALQCSTLNLSRLDLSTNIFGSEGAAIIAKIIKHRTNLQGLNVSVNLIGSDGAVYLAEGLRWFTNLEYLNLSANNIGLKGEKAIAEAIQNLKLKIFNISWNSISTALLFADQSNLEILNVSATNIGSACGRGELIFSSSLKVLNLSQNSIDSNGAAMIAKALKPCTELSELILSCNNIGFEGAMAIADNVSTNLRVLDLSHNQIGDHSFEIAKKLERYPDIKLNLSHNAISSLDHIEGQDVADEIKSLVAYLSHD